jgi:hypothetical protein
MLKSFGIVDAVTPFPIKQATTYIREVNVTTIFVLQLNKATTTTAVTERLPLIRRHLIE